MISHRSKGQPGGYVGLDDSGNVPGAILTAIASACWPIGSIFVAADPTNPAALLGFGTWVAFGVGRVIVGADSGDVDFDTDGETGGEKTHVLTTAEMPAHTHVPRIRTVGLIGSVGVSGSISASDTNASDGATASTGGGGAHNNMPPYVVAHMWKRTA